MPADKSKCRGARGSSCADPCAVWQRSGASTAPTAARRESGGVERGGSYGLVLRSDQVLIDRVHVIVGRSDRLKRDVVFHDELIQKQVKRIGIARSYQHPFAVVHELGFNHMVLGEDA